MGLFVGAILRLFFDRRRLLLENLALRQQLAALKRRHPRPRLAMFDRVFWVLTNVLVWMEAGSHDREPGDGCPLAPIWVCNVLAGHFQRPPDSGPEKDFQGTRRSDLSDGGGELHLGRPTYSRRTSHARFRYLGTNDFPLDETSAQRSRASQTLACLSAKPSGSDCGHGLLYHTDDHVRSALLLFCHGSQEQIGRSRGWSQSRRRLRAPKLSSTRAHLLSRSSELELQPMP